MISIVLAIVVFTLLLVSLSLLVLQTRIWFQPQHSVTVTINNGTTLIVSAGQKLLGELNNAAIAIPSACAGAGTCGLCKVCVTSGGGALLPIELSRLALAERQIGVRLACQLTVRQDMMINIPQSVLSAEKWRCRLISSRNLSALIKELVFDVPDGETFEFSPGMYMQVTAPPFECAFEDITIDNEHLMIWRKMGLSKLVLSTDEETTRAYSIASTPSQTGSIVLLIRLALPPPGHLRDWPAGKVSSWLFSRRPGDLVDVAGPFGDFGIVESERDMILIGGGVGMAPLRAIAHHLLSTESSRLVRFFYGARCIDDLFYQQEFDELAEKHANFSWTVALSEPAATDDWNGDIGFIHEIVKEQHLDSHPRPDKCDYYLCGPPLMLTAVVAMLDQAGVDPQHIFADDFGS